MAFIKLTRNESGVYVNVDAIVTVNAYVTGNRTVSRITFAVRDEKGAPHVRTFVETPEEVMKLIGKAGQAR